jgi:Tfp pilus assembly protein PilZ
MTTQHRRATEHPARLGRVTVTLPVDVLVDDSLCAGVVRNIGIGGMFLTAEQTRPVGDELLLTFSLPGHASSVSVRGQVRWVHRSFASERGQLAGMGIRFLDLASGQLVPLAGFVLQAEITRRRKSASSPRSRSTFS